MNVLVLHAGSSTLKFQLIATDLDRIKQYTDKRLCRGRPSELAEKPSSRPWFVGSYPIDRHPS
jgi:acetate kinase